MTALSVTLDPAAVIDGINLATKRDVLEKAADIAANCYDLDKAEVVSRLTERENLGTTGFGGSVAIPHAKLPDLQKCVGVVLRLPESVEYDAHDGRPVDLVFALFSPENGGVSHLKALAEISRLLRDDNMAAKLRGADNEDAIYALVTGQRGQQAA